MRSTASGIFRKMIALSSFPSASGCSTPCSAPARFWMWTGIKGLMWSSSMAWKHPGGSPSGPSWRSADKMKIGAAELPSRFSLNAPGALPGAYLLFSAAQALRMCLSPNISIHYSTTPSSFQLNPLFSTKPFYPYRYRQLYFVVG